MTAIPVPPVSRIEEEEELTGDSKLKKNLLREFDTPLAVSKRISRLSQKFEELPLEYVIQVFLRLRPFTESEIHQGENGKCLKISADQHILTAMAPEDSKVFKASNRGVGESVQHFTFTKIFDEKTNQNDFYHQTAHPLVKEFVNGQNGLIFTYGVTNSGKTYTLQGSPGNEGVIPQAITNIFLDIGDKMMEDVPFIPKTGCICNLSDSDKDKHRMMKKQVLAMADDTRYSGNQKTILLDSTSDLSQIDSCNTTASENSSLSMDQSDMPVKYAMFVSFVELYCELVYDLLAPISDDKLRSRSRPVLCISDDKKGTSHVKGMREIQVNSAQEVLKVLHAGQKNLHVAATKLNKDSSRSHCIFTLTLVQVMDVPNPHGARISKISFCDLAGSERLSKTGEAGKRLKEAGNINNSLMKLGMCIANLRHNQRYKNEQKKQRTVSFRESKLTRLFRNYLLGESRACMIVNANMCASGFDETVHVLKFSAVAREVQIIDKPRLSRPLKRPRNSLEDGGVYDKNKSSRMTIGWDNTMPPIADVDESTEHEDESESDSESDSESLDESVYQCDVEYWKNREKKYEEIIEMLRTELKRLRSEMSEKETEIRRQCYVNARTQIVQIQENHEEHIEDTIAILTQEQEEKKEIMVKLAINDIKEVKGRYEQKVWDLTVKNTSLENELKICQAKLDENITALNASENKCIGLEVKVNELEMDIDKKSHETDAAKRQSCLSGTGQEESEEDLVSRIEEGKTLIRSLMEEIDEKGKQIEDMQEDNDKLQECLTNLQENTKKVLEEEITKRMKSPDQKLSQLKEILENLQLDISEMERKSQQIMKTHVDVSQDIIVLDDTKSFKCTEGIIQHLLKSSESKDEQVMLLATTLEETKLELTGIQNKLSAADTVRTTIADKDLHLEELETEKLELTAENEDLKQQVRKLANNETRLNKDIAELQKRSETVDMALKELKTEKEKLFAEKEDLIQESRKLSENETRLNKDIAELQKLIDTNSSSKNADNEKLIKVENEVQNKVEILKELRTEMRRKEEENVELKTKLQNVNELLVQSAKAKSELECEVESKKLVIQELRSDIRAKERENEEVNCNLGDIECKTKELQKSLDDVSKCNGVREEKFTMLQLQMDEMSEENHKIRLELKDKESENGNLADMTQKLQNGITTLEIALEESKSEQKSLSKARNLSDSEKSDLEKSLECKEKDYEKLQLSHQEYRARMECHIEEANKYHREELENVKKRHAEELTQLKSDLSRSKTALKTKQDEFDRISENKDKSIKAFEIQVSHEKASHQKVRSELDALMSEVVTLKSRHAAAVAEISQLTKQLEMKENLMQSPSCRPKRSTHVEPTIKLEPLTESPAHSNSRRTKNLSDIETSAESARPNTRSKRGTKRGSSILKRGKCSTRPATPLPEATSDEEITEPSPLKRSRTTDSSVKNEDHCVLDDSELLKETGNVRGFPASEIEIDATPSTSSKKTTRSRRRAGKKTDDSEDPEYSVRTRRPTLRKAKTANSNNSNSNTDEGLASPALSSVSRNINQVGTLLKNSPVGNALKRIEEAISPANKSPKKSRRVVETRKGKRMLGPDDISAPFEASPDVALQDYTPPVSNTPSRMLRSLRSRR